MKILFEGQSLLPPCTGVGRVTSALLRDLDFRDEIQQILAYVTVFPCGTRWSSAMTELHQLPVSSKTRFHRIPLPLGMLISAWTRFRRPFLDSLFSRYDLAIGPAHILPPRNRIPGILTMHDTSLLEQPEWYPRQAHIYRDIMQMGIQTADAILVPSLAVKKSLVENYGREASSIHRVYNPFEGEYPCLDAAQKEDMRNSLFSRPDPFLCWIGEINPRKNVSCLFQIIKELKSRGFPNLRLVLMGQKGYNADHDLALAKELGLKIALYQPGEPQSNADIVLTGYIADQTKKPILAAAEILVFPSLDEGFGYPVLEAMAAGIPVVCSNQGSLPEIAADAAWVVPSTRFQDYINPVETLLSNADVYASYQHAGMERQKIFRANPFDALIPICQSLL